MGQQQTRTKAIEALRLALEEAEPPLSQEQREAVAKCFERELRLHVTQAKEGL